MNPIVSNGENSDLSGDENDQHIFIDCTVIVDEVNRASACRVTKRN